MGDGREQETDLKETDRHRKWRREEGRENWEEIKKEKWWEKVLTSRSKIRNYEYRSKD